MILRVEHGSFAYPKGPELLHDISFTLSPGEVLAILGPNGAGKTTLLRCMTGMLRWSGGGSWLGEERIAAMRPRKLWRTLAYVPQAKAASMGYTAFQTVLLGRSSRIGAFSSPKQADLDRARQAMDRLGIAALAERPCASLSGGEVQMVLIARALAAEPEFLILDEPESNLDFKNQLVVLDAISSLAQEGMACIFNTHYPAHALQRANKALLLSKDGATVFGPTSEVVTPENIRRVFGVNALIGEFETPERMVQNILPLSIARGEPEAAVTEDRRRIAATTLIFPETETAGRINALLHEFQHLIIGRMGMPHRKSGLNIINLTLEGPEGQIRALTHQLQLLPGLSVKTTFAMDARKEAADDQPPAH